MLKDDHQQVTSSGAIESYVLGHLTPQEMEQLEVHLFECPECATELRQTAMFLTNAHVVLRERLPETVVSVKPSILHASPAGLFQHFRTILIPAVPAIAALVFLGLYTHEALVVNPALQRDLDAIENGSPDHFLLKGATRGDDDAIVYNPAKKNLVLYFDPTWPGNPAKYHCTLRKASGEQIWTDATVAAPASGQFVFVGVPTRLLSQGDCFLEVRDASNPAAPPLGIFPARFRSK